MNVFYFYRKYDEACTEKGRSRAAFTTAYQERYGRQVGIHYPQALRNLPKFPEWLQQEVGAAADSVVKPSAEEVEESRLPENVAIAYRAMYAHGMHLRIRTAEEEKVTCDSAVAAAVLRRNRGRSSGRGGQLQKQKYVGWVEEIMELDYRNHYYVVLVCSWILGTLTGQNPKVIRDDYGFTLGNFRNTMALGPDSFAFPTQCIQVFYSDDQVKSTRTGGDWKVICSTDVRGRRGDFNAARPDIDMLAMGRDSDFHGLQIQH